MNNGDNRWSSALQLCVKDHYGQVLDLWTDTGLEPGSWRETLCWAGMLHWNSVVFGLHGMIKEAFPNSPKFSEVIGRLHDYSMFAIANGFEQVLEILGDSPEYPSDIPDYKLIALLFPMREGWEKGFVNTSIIFEEIPESKLKLYYAYRSICGNGGLFEMYRFLENTKMFDESASINTDLEAFR